MAEGQKQNKPLLSQAPYRGRVQAQGDDIEKDGGYSCPWAQNVPVTDRDGLSFLAKIEEQCTKSQKAQRKQAFAKAKRFVKLASEQGGVRPEAQPRSFQDSKRTVSNARVDIEISFEKSS
ncbi:MAG TPA: hypothetical protein DEG17_00805 [Cyanobacteria bacterium UBA11149]|nr:hypothetical protein [Cyanobacteria bacterium UBA11367]HBE57794.1 hypothetical protein [Cyanobacteria bacterium UBA11366]HBK65608.1 hypothetical protein [Cyanobacteria bacterium UBA11166]HBR73427.1 hypothetical protein [Cyanobacteria bacterium UBA11159]HBS68496.1 hypothetical protein [Cyanobacteria bacterium UBA11153]HBW87452.1 hypothetical protein [Cyanobacteria bacterium UBA11149]HCA93851.1 hypothetical protein [Cyanobacteria bacterium UBA9226]